MGARLQENKFLSLKLNVQRRTGRHYYRVRLRSRTHTYTQGSVIGSIAMQCSASLLVLCDRIAFFFLIRLDERLIFF